MTPYHNTQSNIRNALSDIVAILNKNQISITLPMTYDGLSDINIGTRLDFTDTSLISDITATMWVRSIQYDFDDDEITFSGEGSIS